MQPSKYYTSIVDLPLNRFIDCLVDENLFALVITGEPSKTDLQSAWDGILIEYNDLLGDTENKMYFRLLREVHLLMCTIKQIELNVAILKLQYNKADADELNGLLNSNFPFDFSDTEKYYSDLDRCIRMGKGTYLKYQLKNNQLQALKEKNDKANSKPTKEYFAGILISLTDHAGVKLNASEITVYEFCERVRRYTDYIKTIESRNKK
jgi:hypothetical protein